MNHKLWTSVGARVIALAFVIAGASACHDKVSDVSSGPAPAVSATASSQVIGTAPAEPSGDPPGTSPVAANTTDITKKEETMGKPQEGDNHSYNTVSPDTKQKTENKDPQMQPERSKQ
jgi:hypothetical protein